MLELIIDNCEHLQKLQITLISMKSKCAEKCFFNRFDEFNDNADHRL